jgi:hypothetical protein
MNESLELEADGATGRGVIFGGSVGRRFSGVDGALGIKMPAMFGTLVDCRCLFVRNSAAHFGQPRPEGEPGWGGTFEPFDYALPDRRSSRTM